MAIVPAHQPSAEAPAPPAICPACGTAGNGHRIASVPADVPRAEYLCDNGHLWITSWFAGEAA